MENIIKKETRGRKPKYQNDEDREAVNKLCRQKYAENNKDVKSIHNKIRNYKSIIIGIGNGRRSKYTVEMLEKMISDLDNEKRQILLSRKI